MTLKPYKVKSGKPKIKLLIYGKPGVGKTLFAAEAQLVPALSDVLFINIEGGLLTVSNSGALAIDIGKTDDNASNGHIVADFEKVIWSLANKLPGFENINTVVCDSASELQTRDLEDIVITPIAQNQKKHDIDARTREDYGANTTRLKRIFRMLKDLDKNVIFTAIAKNEIPQGKLEPIEVGPALTAKVAEALMGYVDFVWYMYKNDKDERCLLTEEKGIYRAKTRNKAFFDAIGKVVVKPSLPEIYGKLEKVINESR